MPYSLQIFKKTLTPNHQCQGTKGNLCM